MKFRRSLFRKCIAGVFATVITVSGALPGAGQNSDVGEVFTVAGSGELGMSDGDRGVSSFLLPIGVAVARNGSVFVTDEAANRVREVTPAGRVNTVAGSGTVGPLGFSVIGGYKDGPALQAQFNHPTGIAVSSNGIIYVADSNNNCIRKIQAGVVSTLVGKPGEAIVKDGGAAVARLVSPRSLSLDSAGTLWIADYGGGLRRLDSNGVVSTVQLKVGADIFSDNRIFSVSSFGERGSRVVFVAAPRNLLIYHEKDNSSQYIEQWATDGNGPYGWVTQVVALSAREAAFSDAESNNIRYVRVPTPSFASGMFTNVIAGGQEESGDQNAGFRDGAPMEARFYGPTGIAAAGGHLIVADSGNRRIRAVPLPATQLPEDPANLGEYDKAHFEIAVVGASYTYYDTSGADSICSLLRDELTVAHYATRPVRCHSVRMDSAGVQAIQDYVENYIAPRKVDLVITLLNPVHEFPSNYREVMREIKAQLDKSSEMMVYWIYDYVWISDNESVGVRLGTVDEPGSDMFPDELRADLDANRLRNEEALTGTGILSCDSFADFARYEKEAHLPLYFTTDVHPNHRGNAFHAQEMAKCLIKRGD